MPGETGWLSNLWGHKFPSGFWQFSKPCSLSAYEDICRFGCKGFLWRHWGQNFFGILYLLQVLCALEVVKAYFDEILLEIDTVLDDPEFAKWIREATHATGLIHQDIPAFPLCFICIRDYTWASSFLSGCQYVFSASKFSQHCNKHTTPVLTQNCVHRQAANRKEYQT